MSFLFSVLDMLLIVIMLFDTLGLIYQFRKSKESVTTVEFNRIYFSWILFLTIYSTFSCSWKGFFGTLIRLILFAAKAYVTIPKCGGSLKLHKILIDDDKAKECFYKVLDMVKSKLCKCENKQSQPNNITPGISSFSPSETVEPESNRNDEDYAQSRPNE